MARPGPTRAGRLLAILALLGAAGAASGGLGPSLFPGPRGQSGATEALEVLLRAATLEPRRASEIGPLVRDLGFYARQEGLSQAKALAAAFPRPESILSMLALDRDVDDFAEAGEGKGPAADHYRRAALAAQVYRPLRSSFARLFSEAWEIQAGPARLGAGAEATAELALADLAPPKSLEAPDLDELPFSHPYALDIFFAKVERRAGVEKGPPISALEEGIVVAASGNWRGGAGASTWKSGGLSPAAGNGVVIYSPRSGRYYSYFHFSEVKVEPGSLVSRGGLLGRGGNSGANARKPEHGRHVHLEIFDAQADRALSAWEIRRLLF